MRCFDHFVGNNDDAHRFAFSFACCCCFRCINKNAFVRQHSNRYAVCEANSYYKNETLK